MEINDLPIELKIEIYNILQNKDRINLATTNKQFRNIFYQYGLSEYMTNDIDKLLLVPNIYKNITLLSIKKQKKIHLELPNLINLFLYQCNDVEIQSQELTTLMVHESIISYDWLKKINKLRELSLQFTNINLKNALQIYQLETLMYDHHIDEHIRAIDDKSNLQSLHTGNPKSYIYSELFENIPNITEIHGNILANDYIPNTIKIIGTISGIHIHDGYFENNNNLQFISFGFVPNFSDQGLQNLIKNNPKIKIRIHITQDMSFTNEFINKTKNIEIMD